MLGLPDVNLGLTFCQIDIMLTMSHRKGILSVRCLTVCQSICLFESALISVMKTIIAVTSWFYLSCRLSDLDFHGVILALSNDINVMFWYAYRVWAACCMWWYIIVIICSACNLWCWDPTHVKPMSLLARGSHWKSWRQKATGKWLTQVLT